MTTKEVKVKNFYSDLISKNMSSKKINIISPPCIRRFSNFTLDMTRIEFHLEEF